MTAEAPPGSPPPQPGASPRRPIRRFVPYFFIFTLAFAALVSLGQGGGGGGTSALLRGPDDLMRMVQVIDWIDGQGWTDTVQRRLDPPNGVAMHWSRLADIPLAAMISLAGPWRGRTQAVHLAALLIPPLLGGLLVALFLWAALPLTPDRRALVPVLMTAALIIPLLQLLPGRIDHHGLQLVATVLALGFLFRALEPRGVRAAVGLGITGGVSLAIGLETLPFLGAATVILCLAWIWRGGAAAAAALAAFGAALPATAAMLIPLTLPPAQWTAMVCDRLSLALVALTAIVLAAGMVALAVERRRPMAVRPLRLALAGGLGMGGLALVALAFPQCAGGPYANLSAEALYWLKAVSEARAFLDFYHSQPAAAVAMAILPVAALVSVVWQWARSNERADPRWPALVVLVASGLALMAWQIRGASYAGLVAAIALIPLAATVNAWADRSKRILARVGLRVMVPMICVFAVAAPYGLLGPASGPPAAARGARCDVLSALAALTDPAGLAAEVRIIAAPVDVGPHILFLTRHKVLAAPYHRNVRGLADNRRIFAGTEKQALATIRARKVGAILYCRKYAPFSAYGDRPAFLNDRLGAGRPPPWLVPVMGGGGLGLFRVRPARGAVP